MFFDFVVFQFYSLTELYINTNTNTNTNKPIVSYDTSLYFEEGCYSRQEG